MLERYRKTFFKTQVLIWAVSLTMGFVSRDLKVAATFFAFMQASAFFGAAWGARLKRKVDNKFGFTEVGQ